MENWPQRVTAQASIQTVTVGPFASLSRAMAAMGFVHAGARGASGQGATRAIAQTKNAPFSGAFFCNLERETRLELATSTLARLRSTN